MPQRRSNPGAAGRLLRRADAPARPGSTAGAECPHAMISWTDLHLKRPSMESFELVLVLLARVIIAAAGVVCFQFAIAAAPPRLREQHRPRALRGLHALRCLSARRGTARERHLGRGGSGGLPMRRARSSRSIEASNRRCRSAWAIRTSSRAWARARCSIRRPAC